MLVKSEKHLKEQINTLEMNLKTLTDANSKLIKDKKNYMNLVDYLKKEIETRQKDIMNKIKIISNKEKSADKEASNNNNDKNKQIVSSSDDIIKKQFNLIQRNYNLNINEKLKSNIESLLSMQKVLKVNYIIVKKLDIKEEFLKFNRLQVSSEFFDNLKSLSKIGKLNFAFLKTCGPILVFRIIESSTFDEIKKVSCETWNVNIGNYSIYDDSFNNMDCCLNTKLTSFFSTYLPYDRSLKPGEVCFYLFEKLKHQGGILDSQLASIDTKSSSKEEDKENKGQNGFCDFNRCMDLFRSKKILKGIDSYNVKKIDRSVAVKRTIKMVDNYLIFILSSTILIVKYNKNKALSMYSILAKKDVKFWGNSMWQNHYILSKYLFNNYYLSKTYNVTVSANPTKQQFNQSNQLDDINSSNFYSKNFYKFNFTEISDYLFYYNEFIKDTMNTSGKIHMVLMGPIRLRFLRTKLITNCLNDYSNKNPLIVTSDTLNSLNIKCYSLNHDSLYSNQTKFLNYNFSNNLGIGYNLTTPIGLYDNTGVVIDFYRNNISTSSQLKDLNTIIEKPSTYLGLEMRAVELSFTYYSPTFDVFLTNLIFIERDVNNSPFISIHESIPFLFNMYESKSTSSIKIIDTFRLVLFFLLIISYLSRIVQRYLNIKERSFFKLVQVFFITTIQLKHIILLSAIFAYFFAYLNFTGNSNITSQSIYDSKKYFDAYTFASNQKVARSAEIISLFLICLYSLKFFQIFETVNIFFIAFKKSYFEYFILTIIIVVIFLGLSFLTNFVYGEYIFEYRDFLNSIIINFRIFILNECTDVTSNFLKYFKGFSIAVVIIFIFLLRYFIIEYGLYNANKPDADAEDEFSFNDKLKLLLIPCSNKKKVDNQINANDQL